MPANSTVLYPASSDLTFDLDYYLKKHMPLAVKKWAKYGLKDWKVVQFAPGADGSQPYSIGAILTWESADGIRKALTGEEAAEVMGDVKNYTNKNPVFLLGDVVGASS